MRLKLDGKLRCTDGGRATLSDVVVEPVSRRATHVVVHAHGDVPRLVPSGVVATPVKLACTTEDLRGCEAVQSYAFLHLDEFPEGDAEHDVGVESMVTTPSSDFAGYGGFGGELDTSVGLVFDRIPRGDVELRSSSDVYSSDGHRLGNLDSVLVHDDGALTHIVARTGGFFRRRTLAIPIEVVSTIITDRIETSLSKAEATALPRLSRAAGATSRSSDPSPDGRSPEASPGRRSQ